MANIEQRLRLSLSIELTNAELALQDPATPEYKRREKKLVMEHLTRMFEALGELDDIELEEGQL